MIMMMTMTKKNATEDDSFKLYPNPVNDILTVESKESLKTAISIYMICMATCMSKKRLKRKNLVEVENRYVKLPKWNVFGKDHYKEKSQVI